MRVFIIQLFCVYLCLQCCRVEALGEIVVWIPPRFLSYGSDCCTFYVSESTGSLQMCAEIMFINGTALTTTNFTVTMHTNGLSGSARNEIDYTFNATNLVFPAGSARGDSQCAEIDIIDDEAVEYRETFYVELSTNDSQVEFSEVCQRTRVRINDNDYITVVVTENTTDVDETDRSVRACVNITNGYIEGTSAYIYYYTSSGSASANRDYYHYSSSRRMYFYSGDEVGDSRCVSLTIYDDTRVENDEYYYFTVSGGSRAIVSQDQRKTKINIIDNDVAIIGLVDSAITRTESSNSISLCIELMNSVQLDVYLSALIETQGITATEDADYVQQTGNPITMYPGYSYRSRGCTSITINEDDIVEYNEVFNVILTENSTKLTIPHDRNITQITIREDNDFVNIGFQSLQFITKENSSAVATVCAQIDRGSLEREVVAYLTTTALFGDLAMAYRDYIPATFRPLRFVSGQSANSMPTQCTDLEVIDDNILENDETFSVGLSSRSNQVYVTVGREQAEVIIREDETDFVLIGFPLGAILSATEGITTAVNICPQILEGILERNVSVNATTSDISARDYMDYIGVINEEITFLAGQRVQCIQMNITDDENVLEEELESFRLNLTASESFVILPNEQDSIVIDIYEDPEDSISVGLQQTSYNVSEVGGTFGFCIEMFDGYLERNVSLTVTTTDGSARAPNDYIPLNTQLVFETGQTAVQNFLVCGTIDIVDDNVVEENEESLTLSLSPDAPSATLITAPFATIIINEDGNDVAGSITLSSSGYEAYESEEGVHVCAVIMAEALEREVIVQLSSHDFTARNFEDFIPLFFVSLTFDDGAISGDEQCYRVVIIDDNILEGSEDFLIQLTSSELSFLGSNLTQATVTIHPDPADFVEFGLQQDRYSVSEQPMLNRSTVCVDINNGTLEREVVVSLDTMDITSEDGIDYVGLDPMMLTFTSGQTVGAQHCAVLFAIDDSLIEDSEIFNVSLAALPSEENIVRFTIGEDVATITIVQDPNDRAVIQLQNSTYYSEEGDDISVCAELVSVEGGLRRPLSVSWTILNGTAKHGVDFISSIAVSETLAFPLHSIPGDTLCIMISVLNDTFYESNEDFIAELSTRDPSVIISEDANLAVVTIGDVPYPLSVAVSFVLRDYSDTEGIGLYVEVCVQIVFGTLSQTASVDLWTVSQSAIAGSDFSFLNTTLTFLPGETVGNSVHCANISILNDQAVEAEETFTVVLVSNSIIQIFGRTSIEITIYEDISDFVTVGLQMPLSTAMENEEFMVCAELTSGYLQRDVFVHLEVEDSMSAMYYEPSLLNFTSGQSMGDVQCANLTILDDSILSGQRNLSIRLRNQDENGDGVKIDVNMQSIDIIVGDDADDQISVGFSRSIFIGSEHDGFAQICAEILQGELGTDISILVAFANDSANFGWDYTDLQRVLSFVSGQSLHSPSCVNVTLIDDDILEHTENFSVTLSTEFPGVSITRAQSIVEIIDNDNIMIGLHPLTASVREGETFSVCVELISGSLERSVIVPLEAVNNSARQGVDFIGPEPSLLTFISGQSMGDIQCANVTILDDTILSRQKNLSIRLIRFDGDGSVVRIDANMSSFDIIIDIDTGDEIIVGFSQSIFAVFEGDGFVEICAELLEGELGNDIYTSVSIGTFENYSATSGQDYMGLPQVISFVSGQSLHSLSCVNVTITDDAILEDTENFTVVLSTEFPGVTASRAQSTSIVEIIDDDNNIIIGLHPLTTPVREGETFPVCAELMSASLERNIIVALEAVNSSAIEGIDFIGPEPSLLTFISGQSMGDVQCANISFVDNTNFSGQRTLSIGLRVQDGDGSGVRIVNNPSIDIIINVNTNVEITVGFSQLTFTASEDDHFVQICAELLEGELRTDIHTLVGKGILGNDSATFGLDYVGLPQVLSFVSGQCLHSLSCVNVTIVDDSILEEMENFTVVLSSEYPGVCISRAHSIVGITDNDNNITISLRPLPVPVIEGERFPICAQIISGSLERNIFVVLEAVNNSAKQGVDFIGPDPSVLRFTAGQSTGDEQCAHLTIVDDSILEGDRNFKIRLANNSRGSSAGVFLSISVPVIDIEISHDIDDKVTVGFSQPIVSGSESDGLVQICAEVSSGQLGIDISLPLRTDIERSSLTATDYFGLPKAVTFVSGQLLSCFNLSIVDDNEYEGKETITLTLSLPTGITGVIVSRSQSVIQIIDNDKGPQNKTETMVIIALYVILAIAVMIATALCILIGVLSLRKSNKKGPKQDDNTIPLTMIN